MRKIVVSEPFFHLLTLYVNLIGMVLQRLQDIQALEPLEQQQLFNVMDALIRDYKAKKVYGA